MEQKVLIIGAGPAGCAAALTLRLRGFDVTMVYSGDGALGRAKRVDNYPGTPQIAGSELLKLMRKQAEDMGAKLLPGLVRYIQKTKKQFQVLAGDDILFADAVLLASGTSRVNLIEGESELLGHGVSYCATCDGMLYRNRDVAVIVPEGGFEEDIRFLESICHITLYSKVPRSLAPAGDGVLLQDEEGGKKFACAFILRPAVALTSMMPSLATQNGSVTVDESMKTSVDGVFAAGDIIGAPCQVSRAAGQGNTAALAIAKYLFDKQKVNQ